MLDADLHAILRAEHGNPFAILGMHAAGGIVTVRAFIPWASRLEVIEAATGEVAAGLVQVDRAGMFVGEVPGRDAPFRYRLRAESAAGPNEFEDIYSFATLLGPLDFHLLGEGRHFRSFDKLGAHHVENDGVPGVMFLVWAPSARNVSLVGDFNGWDGRQYPMRLHPGNGMWELFVPRLDATRTYKYEIRGPDGIVQPLKADPYGQQSEHPPRTASVVPLPSRHRWEDQSWVRDRGVRQAIDQPVSIYEVHLGSWRRKEDGRRYLTYREMADELVPYVKEMGFTHLEVMPVSEFPFDGSWGYQPVGLFAPTSRFGTPDDFRYFVDRCHQEGIALWLDWVPGHFPTDPHGLARFDGTSLYEHADPRQGFQHDWNTYIYNFGRREVFNFLLSNALYWLEIFHADGLRVDAVASILYLDYSRKHGEWVPNRYGGRENLEAIDLLRELNQLTAGLGGGAVNAAEESTAWPGVSRPVSEGGLGFGYKWNMGWMHDTLRYMSSDPIHRAWQHDDMTFGMVYAFTENFILPLSHDEVVHGKGSLIDKMPGDWWQKFANLRAYYSFMWTHPGKKLLFMGCEFAQWREWNHDRSLDWHLLEFETHRGVQTLIRDLNHLYRSLPALHQQDCDPAGFAWLEAGDRAQSVLAYLRRGREAAAVAIVVCNFTPVVREAYRVGVPGAGRYAERLNSDAAIYGGGNVGNGGGVEATAIPWQGQSHSIVLRLPPLATLVLTPERGGE